MWAARGSKPSAAVRPALVPSAAWLGRAPTARARLRVCVCARACVRVCARARMCVCVHARAHLFDYNRVQKEKKMQLHACYKVLQRVTRDMSCYGCDM